MDLASQATIFTLSEFNLLESSHVGKLLLRMQNAERGGQHYNSQVIEQIRAATHIERPERLER